MTYLTCANQAEISAGKFDHPPALIYGRKSKPSAEEYDK
jgi:hypothetical protein